mmetsp:Transcript_23493/g.35679  ORF Transcript_23493/g.35679 Transcript_23493/m.35679 type:complete len:95 (-) Transcript_23493:2715-2999(-)
MVDHRCKFILQSHAYEPISYERVFYAFCWWMLKRWKQNVARSWERWWDKNSKNIKLDHPDHYDLIHLRGNTAVKMAKGCSFWEWQIGSAVFFWR